MGTRKKVSVEKKKNRSSSLLERQLSPTVSGKLSRNHRNLKADVEFVYLEKNVKNAILGDFEMDISGWNSRTSGI